MTLFFKAINNEGEIGEFSFYFRRLELGLDLLSAISLKVGPLLSVELIEKKSRFSLPVDAFDGQPLSEQIQSLKKQWQQVLNEPVTLRTTSRQRLISIMQQQIKNQQASILQYERALSAIKNRLQMPQLANFNGLKGSRLRIRDEMHFAQCQLNLTKAMTRQQSNSDRLCHLQELS